MLRIQKNPDIKKYLWFYVGVVVLVVGFFILTSIYYTPEQHDTKVFDKTPTTSKSTDTIEENKEQKFKLLDRAY
ncbi:MAG: hypothetical protein WC144_08195 [Sulfurimonas sp.]|nr:hypothetical protein [Sulfurimonadaceae bacterium]